MSTGLRQYTIPQYISQAKKLLIPNEEKDSPFNMWDNFYLDMVAPFVERTPRITFLYGSLDKEEPQRQPRKQKEREKPGDKVVAKELKRLGDKETETSKKVQHIYSTLTKLNKNNVSPNFWEFIHDSTSFSRTVENLFHLSFLTKDGHVRTKQESIMPEVGESPS
eukprot:TRINITY_DN6247_c0_g1_i5.p1 TRINITY_DN6247_c0_g1~~TRINITY_DN6247_c0_g1_i5.p1  ORF type:complete len:165 (-),score=36.91 TRINITY_DN6247_c0_g1_i5:519-1013(-)